MQHYEKLPTLTKGKTNEDHHPLLVKTIYFCIIIECGVIARLRDAGRALQSVNRGVLRATALVK